MEYVQALGLERGITAVVGAGGKKSTIYDAAGAIDRAVVTSTVRIPPFDENVAELHRTSEPAAALETVESWPVGLAAGAEESRYLGYEPSVIEAIADHAAPAAVLVKADGARNREFKAPGEDEPRIPPAADRVLGIASVQVVGEPLDENRVHRPERVRALTGRAVGETVTVEDVVTVLTSEAGTEKAVPESAEFIPVLNKADTEADLAVAREIADGVLERGRANRVAITRLIDAEPLLELRS
ncbi:MAG: selenium cofactor biosynthesis protein YqeC [Halodesulfurarchaeum sp.]